MEFEIFYPNGITLEMIICYMSQALVFQTALIIEKFLAIRSDFVKISQEKGKNSWPLVCRGRECATEHDNVAEPVDDVGQEHSDSVDQVDGNRYEEDQINDGGDWNSEGGGDDDEGGSDGGTESSDGDDSEDEEEEDDDDEGYWLSDDEEEEDEEEEEDDEPGYGSILKHAREVYKPTSFLIFEHEYKKSRTLSVHVDREDYDRKGLVFEYDVQKIGHHFDYRKHRVIAWPLDGIVQCDCKYFDVAGILCCHALKALACLRIENIPEQYILERHTKDESCSPIEDGKRKGSSSPDRNHQSRSIEGSGACKEVAEGGFEMNMDLIDAPLLRHAREVYVADAFRKFQEEYKQSEYVFLSRDRETYEPTLGIVLDCTIIYPRRSKHYKVHAETQLGRVDCSCNGFQKTGVLCSHALCVLDSLCIERIPDQYISMSSKKDPGHKEVRGIHGENYSELAKFCRYNAVMESLVALCRKASQTEEATKFLNNKMCELLAKFEDPSYGKENSCETDKESMDECGRIRTEDDRKDDVSPSRSPPRKSQKKSESSCSEEGTPPVQDKKR